MTEYIIIAIAAFALGFLVTAKRYRQTSLFLRQEIWACECKFYSDDTAASYGYCLTNGKIVEEASNPFLAYYVFNVFATDDALIIKRVPILSEIKASLVEEILI